MTQGNLPKGLSPFCLTPVDRMIASWTAPRPRLQLVTVGYDSKGKPIQIKEPGTNGRMSNPMGLAKRTLRKVRFAMHIWGPTATKLGLKIEECPIEPNNTLGGSSKPQPIKAIEKRQAKIRKSKKQHVRNWKRDVRNRTRKAN